MMTLAQPTAGALSVPLSVLELGARLPQTRAEQAVQEVVETARAAEENGYHRVWVAEHHSTRRTAGAAPAVLIAHIAALTERIRVGSGGVMLPNHPPLSVAEQFATLQALHPGRIDLGIGRSLAGPSAQGLLEAALRREPRAAAEFPERIDELLGFLHHLGPDRNRFHALPLTPRTATPPEVHVLGASESSARIAARRGLPFAYGHHLGASKSSPAALGHYRDAFTPVPESTGLFHGTGPYVVASVNVVCAETDERAEDLALRASARLADPGAELAPDETLSSARARDLARRILEENQVVRGGPAKVAAELAALAASLGPDELMVVPYELTGSARRRTLRLTAGAWRAVRAERRPETTARR